MEKEEKGALKKEEFLQGTELKLGGGKSGGNTTPPPPWRFGLTPTDDSRPQDLYFPSNSAFTAISARKLGANLWEVVPPIRSQHQKSNNRKGCDCEIGQQHPDACDPLAKKPTCGSDLRNHFVPPMMQKEGSLERNERAIPPESPGSTSSMEMTPYRPAISPNGSRYLKGRARDSSYNLKTSTELVKVLNRIWSLEEQHASNISLMKAMKKELDHARGQIRELLKEKKKHREEMDDMMKHLAEDKIVRKNTEDGQVKDAVRSMKNDVEDERKLRKQYEKVHRKLAQELMDVKSSYSNALKELDRERKARVLLEDLCDEFAKGIRDYEQEILQLRKNISDKADWNTRDRLILHLSEAWLDERMQMKLSETGTRIGFSNKKSILDKLGSEIETFLKAQKSAASVPDELFSSKLPTRKSNTRRCSLESFQLNEPGSAPQHGIDEEDFPDGDLYVSLLKRDSTPKPRNDTSRLQQVEDARVAKSNRRKKKLQSREDVNVSGVLASQIEPKGQLLSGVSQKANESRVTSAEPAQTRGGDPAESTVSQTAVGVELSGNKNLPEKERNDHLIGVRMKDPSSSGYKQQREKNKAEIFFDPAAFDGTTSPAEKWISKALIHDPQASGSYSRLDQGTIKENTLKAMLLEARLESQHSRSGNFLGER